MRSDVEKLSREVADLVQSVKKREMRYVFPAKFTENVGKRVELALGELVPMNTQKVIDETSKSVSTLNSELARTEKALQKVADRQGFSWQTVSNLALAAIPFLVSLWLILGAVSGVSAVLGLPWIFEGLRGWFEASAGWWKILPGAVLLVALGGFCWAVYALGRWVAEKYQRM